MKKLRLYVNSIVFTGLENTVRVSLSIMGIVIGVVLMTFVLLFADSYYNGEMKATELMPENSMLISQLSNQEVNNIIDDDECGRPIHLYAGTSTVEAYHDRVGSLEISYAANIIGSPAQTGNSAYVNGELCHLATLELISGRLITNEDVAAKKRVIVIDDQMARILYDADNPIGKTITVFDENRKLQYDIVGVVKSNYSFKNDLRKLDNKKVQKSDAVYLKTCFYIPNSVFFDDFDQDIANNILLWSYDELETALNCEAILKTKENGLYNDRIITKQRERERVYENIETYKELFLVLFIVVFVFSGLNSMNIFFFAVKERTSEIGIRKACGASKIEILFQFVLESVTISVIAYIIGIVIALLLMTISMPIFNAYLENMLLFEFKAELLLFPLFITILQGIVFSLIPGFYASSIKIVEALRFE